MEWLPDRRGLATGIALSAFVVGAAIAPAMIHAAIDYFAVAPDFIGPLVSTGGGGGVGGGVVIGDSSSSSLPPLFVELTTLTDGSQVVAETSTLGTPGQSVVVATEGGISKIHNIRETGPAAYALGTGDTGAAKAFWNDGTRLWSNGITRKSLYDSTKFKLDTNWSRR